MKKQVYKLGLVAFLGLSAMTFAQQDGAVGINTDTPSATLDVKTKAGVTKSLRVENTSGAETVTVLENGKVGIGTESPDAKLEIKSTGNGAKILRFQTERPWIIRQRGEGGQANLSLETETAGKAFLIKDYKGENMAQFYSANEVSSNIISFAETGGRVAIGTAIPNSEVRLDVNGKIRSAELVGSGDRPIVADSNGILKIGQATGTSNETLIIPKTVEVVPNTTDTGNGLTNVAEAGKNLRNYNGTGVPDYQDSDYMIVLTNPAVNGNLQLPSAAANPGRIIYLINGTAYGLGFSATGTGVEDTYPYNFATLANRSGVAFVSTGKTWYPIGR